MWSFTLNRHRMGSVAGGPRHAPLAARLASLPQICVPIIVIHGTVDGVKPQQNSEKYQRFFYQPLRTSMVCQCWLQPTPRICAGIRPSNSGSVQRSMTQLLSLCCFRNRRHDALFTRSQKALKKRQAGKSRRVARCCPCHARPGLALSLIGLFFFVQGRYCDRPNARYAPGSLWCGRCKAVCRHGSPQHH